MILSSIINDVLSNPNITTYIILIQLPVVLCLFLQSLQAYKLGFKEYRLISTAWFINFIYLIVNVILRKIAIEDIYLLIVRAVFDIFYMYCFLFAIKDTIDFKPFNKLQKIPKTGITLIFIIAGIGKIVPGSFHILPYIHIRYIPLAVVDFSILYCLAVYFKNQTKKFGKNRSLFYFTFLYAAIQFLSVLIVGKHERNFLLVNVDNIGFILGLVSKIGILIFLSVLLINTITSNSENEKDVLFHKLDFATKIFNIKEHLSSKKTVSEQETAIFKSVLIECLNMLNEKLGHFDLFDEKKKEIQIQFASDAYHDKIGYKFSYEKGMTGKAVRTKDIQVMSNLDHPDYFRFGKSVDDDVKSAVAIPVLLDGKVIGAYVFESEQEGCFKDIDIRILSAVIMEATTAVKNIRLVQEIELSKMVLDSLKQIDRAIVDQNQELKIILDFILKCALELAAADDGNIALKIPNKEELEIIVSSSPRQINWKIDINKSISGRSFKQGKHDYIPDINLADEVTKELYQNYFEDDEIVCELVVPLIARGEVIGIFNTESRKANKFTENDIERIEGFAGQAAIAIQIFKLFEEVKRHRDQFKALAEIEKLIIDSDQGLSKTLEAIIEGVNLIGKKYAEIVLLEKNEKEEYLVIKKSSDPFDESRILPMRSICGLTLEKKGIVYLPFIDKSSTIPTDINKELVYIPKENERLFYNPPKWGKMKSELALPLFSEGKVIGIFNIESEEYHDFREDEIRLLMRLASECAIAIHNAQQFDVISNKNIELRNSVDKDKIKMSAILGRVMNHRIGNSVGMIRLKLLDFIDGEYGEFNDEILTEFKTMLSSAEKVIGARSEISKKMEELLELKPTPIDFQRVKETIEQTEEFNSNPKIRIIITGLEDLRPVLIEFNLFMEGVVFELLRNAIKSMPEGGDVIINAISEGNVNIIQFIDSGCGIDHVENGEIFEEGNSKWPKERGGGIGLFELKTIVEFFRGTIDVKSKLNVGSTFTIRLPVY